MQLHVLVVPPPVFEGQNLEQEFSAFMTPEMENVQPNGQVAHAWSGPVLPIRVKQVNARGEPMTDAQKLATETGRRIVVAAAAMKVPIAFFYEPAWIVLQLEDPLTGYQKWQQVLQFQLPENDFPRPPLASTVREVKTNGVRSGIEFKVKAWDMFEEEFEWTGEQKSIQLLSKDDAGRPFTVQIEVQRVQNAKTKEPLTYFMGERIWGMRSIGICADASMWKK
jgi:hypothetical protein